MASNSGKITQLQVTPADESQSATVTFEKETAAKTALLLDNTQLGSNHVAVSSATGSDDFGSSTPDETGDEITQEQKPRSRIIAEYLAHGYAITDQTTQRAIDLDHKHGFSAKFLETLQQLDQKTQATGRAKSIDQKYDITTKATQTVSTVWSGLNSYYEKAAGTPTGQKLVDFYTKSSKQVQDIHKEALRLAELKKTEAAGSSETEPATEKPRCKCPSDSACDCVAELSADQHNSDVTSTHATETHACGAGGQLCAEW